MKRGILLLFVLVLTVAGCASTKQPTAETYDMASLFIFRSADGQPIADGVNHPVKINPVTGAVTSVCVDPLCSHDSADCPLYGIQSAMVSGSRMYYVAGSLSVAQKTGERSGHCEVRAYDMTNGTVKKLAQSEDAILLLGAYRDAVYYAAAVYEDETDGFRYALFRADDRKTTELPLAHEYRSVSASMNTGDLPSIYTFDGDRILWYAPGENGYEFYSTDLAGKILEVFDAANPYMMNGTYADGYAYYSMMGENRGNLSSEADVMRWAYTREIWRSPLDGGDAELLADNAAAWIIAGDTVYYTVLEEEPETFTVNDRTETDWLGGKICAMNADGSGKRLLVTLDCVLDLYDTETFLGAVTEDGVTYLCLAYREPLENHWYESGFEYGLSPDTLIVNTATKTATITRTPDE